ncbi:MAG: nuclease-related domain-containing protein [Cyanobacteria bacterium P01_H01_bin.15]
MTKAGQPIRALARRRRRRANNYLLSAGALGILTLILALLLWSRLLLQMLVISGGLVGALSLAGKGSQFLVAAERADQGAAAEEAIAELVKPLQAQGWQLEFNVRLRRWGDADIVATTPAGRCFVIDVKSHRGLVTSRHKELVRRQGNYEYPFKKNLLSVVKGQAKVLAQARELSYVTPILCFSAAELAGHLCRGRFQGVIVTKGSRLVRYLEKQKSAEQDSDEPGSKSRLRMSFQEKKVDS